MLLDKDTSYVDNGDDRPILFCWKHWLTKMLGVVVGPYKYLRKLASQKSGKPSLATF